MTTSKKPKPVEMTMHMDPKCVDVFVFEKTKIADELFPVALRPERVLVVSTQENPRDHLRGRMVRQAYWFANGHGGWAQELANRLMIQGQVNVLSEWPGLGIAASREKVAEMLDLVNVALCATKTRQPLTKDELKAVLEQSKG
jgi:hypothetical protein